MHQLIKTILFVGILSAVPALAAAPNSNSPDALITSKTKLSLWTTAGVKSSAVHVDTTDGMVTLYGKVPTNEQRAIAEKTAKQVMGVKSVKNLLQVVAVRDEVATAKSDKELKEAADKQLSGDPALKDTKVSVKSVDKGVALLTGEAKSYSEHLRAIADVDRVAGIRRIATEVKTPGDYREDERITFVNPKSPDQPRSGNSDSRISFEVKMRMLTAAQIPSAEISVDTDNGQVSLFGIVPTAEVKNAAGLEASKVSGVLQVDNQLEVVPTSSKKFVDAKDADITRDLALVFKDHSEFKGITTSVKNGTVRLTGAVPSGWDQLNALRIARRVAGVRTVEDDLKIDTSAS